MFREEFYEYIVENFALDGAARRLVDNILCFTDTNYTDDEKKYEALVALLDGAIGLEESEIKNAFRKGALNGKLQSELKEKFEYAAEIQMDELDFYMDLLECGYTLSDICVHLPENYEHSRIFMEEHGLI